MEAAPTKGVFPRWWAARWLSPQRVPAAQQIRGGWQSCLRRDSAERALGWVGRSRSSSGAVQGVPKAAVAAAGPGGRAAAAAVSCLASSPWPRHCRQELAGECCEESWQEFWPSQECEELRVCLGHGLRVFLGRLSVCWVVCCCAEQRMPLFGLLFGSGRFGALRELVQRSL